MSTVIQVRPQQFVKTAALEQVMQRALRYLRSGYSIHLEGPTGIGKTTLAIHLADCRRQPVMLVMGGHDLTVQGEFNHQNSWFRVACREGWTLIYDEFNRSRPEMNTALLSALGEKMLALPHPGGLEYVPIHPEFRVIFTSNAEEYCGTYSTPSTLIDRVVTMNLPEPNLLAQQQLLVELIGISLEAAALVIRLVQQFFHHISPESRFSLRPQLMIAQICHCEGIAVSADDTDFRQVCRDILLSRSSQSATDANEVLWEIFNQLSRQMPEIKPVTTPQLSLEHAGSV
ncbi:MoxR family ATPase [Leptothoe sp. PORK10 BA2]|uniref:MoxR family ATPase n=1 Tax=Leptothoe sp. PORK10 BA2 TaxID=3110254 RepID=UPI002B20BE09|nr:MoxR family ATPase [Leptothoe sp. PORK10 BA2]MEA5462343.1 MoxR family ATPase [Leptothoe sp. PORK10 BA2]